MFESTEFLEHIDSTPLVQRIETAGASDPATVHREMTASNWASYIHEYGEGQLTPEQQHEFSAFTTLYWAAHFSGGLGENPTDIGT